MRAIGHGRPSRAPAWRTSGRARIWICDLEIHDGDWSFLDQFALPALDRLAGRFNGQLRVTGTTDEPLIRGKLRSAPFHVHWLHLDELTGEVWVDRRTPWCWAT